MGHLKQKSAIEILIKKGSRWRLPFKFIVLGKKLRLGSLNKLFFSYERISFAITKTTKTSTAK